MIVERSFDAERITKIIAHPKVYPWVSDDGSPKAEDYSPHFNPAVFYLAVKDDAGDIGVFTYVKQNLITYEVHTCVLPERIGQSAKKAAVASLQWMFKNSPAKKVITQVPSNNIKALAFAKRCGLKEEGVNRSSFMKGGTIYDQYILGIVEAELCL